MVVEHPAGLMPYFSRKAVTIQRQRGGQQAWPCSTTQISCDTEQKYTDKTLMQAKPCKPRTPRPGAHVHGGGQERDWADAGVVLSRIWQVHVPPPTQCPSPSSWCAPGGARGPAGSRGAGTQCRPARAWRAPPARCSPPSWSRLHGEDTAEGPTGPLQRALPPPPSPSLWRTFLITLYTFWAAGAHTWTCFWAISTRNPGQGRALYMPLVTTAAACTMKAFLPWHVGLPGAETPALRKFLAQFASQRDSGEGFSKAPSMDPTFGKKGHVHIWKSALSISLKSLKGFKTVFKDWPKIYKNATVEWNSKVKTWQRNLITHWKNSKNYQNCHVVEVAENYT